jgi:predicted dienelactone hydrolase
LPVHREAPTPIIDRGGDGVSYRGRCGGRSGHANNNPLRLVILFALFVLFAGAGGARAQDCSLSSVGYRVMHLGGRVVAVWYPTAASPAEYAYGAHFSGMVAVDAPASTACGKPVPMVVFSHGDLGCGLQSIAFTEELARHGYVVAAPDHADAFLCHIAKRPRAHPPPQPNFLKPDTWSDAAFRDRRDDIEAAIDGLFSDSEFGPVIDRKNIGAAGHSLGGYTVVGMAGGWPSWTDPRIRAVLALSPYVMPFQVRRTLASVRVPLMYQGGTLDFGITPFLRGPAGAYRAANPPAYFVELRGAGHFAWVNCGRARTTASCLSARTDFRLIDEYGIGFFDDYLKHKTVAILSEANAALADFEFKLPND